MSRSLAVVALSLLASLGPNAPAAAFSPGAADPDGALGYFSIPMVAGNGANPEVFVRIVDALGNGLGWISFGGLADFDSAQVSGAGRVARPVPFRPVLGASPAPVSSTRIVNVAKTGDQFADAVSGTNTTAIHVGDSVQWMFLDSASFHSTTSGTCSPSTDPYGYGGYSCDSDGNWDSGQMASGSSFTRQFKTAGTYRYYCSVHGYMMTGVIQVSP